MLREAPQDSASSAPMAGAFPPTHWSWVVAAGDAESPEAATALAELCHSYWLPVYAYIRRNGHDPDTAQDLTQEFFRRLIERKFVAGAVQEKGRFRSFLLTVLKRFLVNEWQHTQAQKRGGGLEFLSLDAEDAEARYRLEPADELSADRLYDRRWVLTLLETVMSTLRREYTEAGKGEMFEQLKVFLYGDKAVVPQAEIGARFGLSESAIKSTVHRMRGSYRELLRDEVARTVANRVDVESELRHLLGALRGE